MSSCLRRKHAFLLKKRTCLLVEQEHMSSCLTGRHVFLLNKKHLFLLNKKTCLLVKEYHLRAIWEASGRLEEAPGGSRKLQEAPGGSRRLREAKSDTPHLQCKKFPKMLILHSVFEGTMHFDYIFTVRYERRQNDGSRTPCKAPLSRPWEPLQLKIVLGMYIYI